MIQTLSHSPFTSSTGRGLDFLYKQTRLRVHTDATMDGGFRWLTVNPKATARFLEIALMPSGPGTNDGPGDVGLLRQ